MQAENVQAGEIEAGGRKRGGPKCPKGMIPEHRKRHSNKCRASPKRTQRRTGGLRRVRANLFRGGEPQPEIVQGGLIEAGELEAGKQRHCKHGRSARSGKCRSKSLKKCKSNQVRSQKTGRCHKA